MASKADGSQGAEAPAARGDGGAPKKVAKTLAKTPAKKTAKTPAKKTAKTPAKKTAKTPAKKTAKTPAKKSAKKPAKAPGMRHPAEEQQGDIGVSDAQQAVLKQLRWIFREQTKADKGIDAQIEVVAPDDPLASGRLLALQIKSGESFFREKREDGWWFRSDTAHLRYWLSHSLPVLIVLVDTESNVYWEHLRPGAYEETEEGFRLKITATQKFDAASLTKLAEIAGRADENLELKIETRYAVLPSDTVRALKRAFSDDPMRASRVAAHLAEGRMNPRSAASALTAGTPTWITESPAAEDLWLAIGSFAYDHDEEDLASTAYQMAAGCARGNAARALAFAALTAYAADEQEARRLAEAAVAAGGGILADTAVAITQLPRDTGGTVAVPLSVQQASEEELDREPTVRNFLGELATRTGDLAEGIRQRRAAVAAGGTNAHSMQLLLAQTLLRRAANEGFGHGPDVREALDAAHAALAEQRRFGGPSHKALETVLDIYIAIPELDAAITAALPAAAGGTALDSEASVQAVARRGAMAALGRGRHDAVEQFLSLMEEGPAAREMRAIAESINERLTHDEEVRLWQGLLAEADSDAMLARCAAHLAALGSWPDRIDELVARKILPEIEVDVLTATFEFASGDAAGRAKLLALADRTPRAAHALIEQVRKRGDLAGAADLCREQIARWDDAALNVLLADLLREAGRDSEAADHIAVQVKNAKLPVALRLSLSRWLVKHLHDEGDLDAAISTARSALQIGEDPDLAWNLVALLEKVGRYDQARQELARWQPRPQSEDEARLWMQLHQGQPATPADLATMAALARSQSPGQLRDVIVSILQREAAALVAGGSSAISVTLAEEIKLLIAETSERGVPEEESAVLAAVKPPAGFATLLPQAISGTLPWADVAAAAEHPYAVLLIRRPSGILVSQDLQPMLREAGKVAAVQALDEGRSVIDLSSVYLLALLPERTTTELLSSVNVLLPSRVGRDLARALDGLRSERLTGSAFASDGQGHVRRQALPAHQSRYWQQIGERMLELAGGMRTAIGSVDSPGRLVDPSQEALALAEDEKLPLWADDSALRQRARAASIVTFSLLDLAEVLADRGAALDVVAIRRHLAPHGVGDFQFDCGDLVALAVDHGWQSGPVPTTLRSTRWWEHKSDWRDVWLCVAQRARLQSADALIAVTRAALAGSLPAVSYGLTTQRYQQLAVIALVACHEVGLDVPTGFLSAIAEGINPSVVPKPGFVLKALITEIQDRTVPEAVVVATRLLPGVDLLP